MHDEYDFYPPWEWQPVSNMPDGCVPIIVRYEDNSIGHFCSCDYWHLSHDQLKSIIDFRYE